MGKYIGQDITYGYFEKQTIPVDSTITEYELNRSVSSATAIQVVCERAILEPNEDYVVFTKPNGKSAIKINETIDLSTPEDGTLSLYVIYLGAKLLIPSTGDQDPQLWDAIDQKADISQVHTYVDNKIDDLVNSAPAVLDTLKELSDALGGDENFATTVSDTLAQKADSSSLATVATSGSYNDLNDAPNLAAVATSGSYNDLNDAPNLAAVATSGSYNDLTDLPTIPNRLDDLLDLSVGSPGDKTTLVFNAAAGPYGEWHPEKISYDDVLNRPNLSAVATSGSYNDLTDTPNISDPTNPEFKTVKLTNNLGSPYFSSKEENVVVNTSNNSIQVMHEINIEPNSMYTFDITVSAKHYDSNSLVAKGVYGKIRFACIRQLDKLAIKMDYLNGAFGGSIKEIESTGGANYDFDVVVNNDIDPNTFEVTRSYIQLYISGGSEETVWWGVNFKHTKLVVD